MIKSVGNIVGKHVLKHANPRTCCPPGTVSKNRVDGECKNIVVATTMRSGTHVLIDHILNNFSAYQRKPLYVDFDRLMDHPDAARDQMDRLVQSNGYVIKTHFMQEFTTDERQAQLERLLDSALVVGTWREPEKQRKSLENWGIAPERVKRLQDAIDPFYEWWGPRFDLQIPFDQLTNLQESTQIVSDLAKVIGLDAPKKIMTPRSRDDRFGVYMDKLGTRLLGKHAPRINTDIGFRR